MEEFSVVLRAFLASFEVWKNDLTEDLQLFAQPTVSAYRGLLALVCPVPEMHGSQLSDVEYIFPRNATVSALFEDMPKLGRLLANTLRKEDWWGDVVQRYKMSHGAEQACGVCFLDVFHKVADLAAGAEKNTSTTRASSK